MSRMTIHAKLLIRTGQPGDFGTRLMQWPPTPSVAVQSAISLFSDGRSSVGLAHNWMFWLSPWRWRCTSESRPLLFCGGGASPTIRVFRPDVRGYDQPHKSYEWIQSTSPTTLATPSCVLSPISHPQLPSPSASRTRPPKTSCCRCPF